MGVLFHHKRVSSKTRCKMGLCHTLRFEITPFGREIAAQVFENLSGMGIINSAHKSLYLQYIFLLCLRSISTLFLSCIQKDSY
jgi:hypothetical protein